MGVDETFRRQYGVISRSQALEAGLTARQVRHRVATAVWTTVHNGVYRHGSVGASWETRLLAAVLASGGVASHRCAAALWQLDLYTTPPVEVSVDRGRWARLSGVRCHETTQWALRAETVKRGIPCTGIERTILDCAAVAGWRTVERLAEAAIRKRLTSWPDLAVCLRRHARRGRNGCGTLRALLEARLLNQTIPLSDFSRLVVNLLVEHGLPEPVIEHVIRDDDGAHILQVDLAWPQRRKAWELDGLQFHFGREDVERDRRKRNRAIAQGWVIQEVLWSMYADEPDELVALARRFLLGSDRSCVV